MFGNLGAFVHGNMFAGLFGPAVGVRLDDTARAELEGIDGTGPFGPAERPMGGYLSLPAAWRDDADQSAQWVEKARAYVGSLPPKQPKKKR
jgi:TfoX/Sxy family transcriptional regulator of competence genes